MCSLTVKFKISGKILGSGGWGVNHVDQVQSNVKFKISGKIPGSGGQSSLAMCSLNVNFN